MTIHVPLTVRIQTGRRDSDITHQINDDMTFRIAIPGGYASLSFTLNRPLDITPDDIAYFAKVFIYDGRNGRTIWEGRLEDPGRGAGDSGEVWSITATGPSAHARDINFPVVYVDAILDRWHYSRYTTPSKGKLDIGGELPDLTGITDADGSAPPCLLLHADEGTAIDTTWTVDCIYRTLLYTGQFIARLRADFVCGGASSNYQGSMFGRVGDASANFSIRKNWVTTADTISANLGTAIPVGTNVISLRAERNVSSTTADAFAWIAFYHVIIRAVIKNADGTDNNSLTGYNVNNIDPVEVVADLLGRALPQFDGPNAVLIGSGVDINQLAYPDGTTAADVFDDIAVFDPGFYWAAWESNPANGKYRFEYVPWPSTVRYEADTDEGFDSPGSASDLYNQVDIRWRQADMRIRHTVRTQVVPELTAAGLTRTAYIDISDEMGELINAQYIGDNFLAEHRYPPNAGTLTIGKPILDNLTGRMAMPWELLPGGLIRVRGVSPRVDALNPSNRDGVTIFRVISTEYSVSTGVATLELDSYNRTIARQLANLETARLRKR